MKKTMKNSGLFSDYSICKSVCEAMERLNAAPSIELERELELARIIQQRAAGAEKAKIELYRHNLAFVAMMAAMRTSDDDLQLELFDEGLIALFKCTANYDPERGFKFVTFADCHVREAMSAYLRDKAQAIRLPKNQHDLVNKLHKAQAKAQAEGSILSVEAFAEQEKMSHGQMLTLRSTANSFKMKNIDNVFHLGREADEQLGSAQYAYDEDASADEGCCPVSSIFSTENLAFSEENYQEECLRRYLNTVLTENEVDLFVKSKGLFGCERVSNKELALSYGIAPKSMEKKIYRIMRKVNGHKELLQRALAA